MFRPIEAFSWGQRSFDPDQSVPGHDPAVEKFPHLFVPADDKPVERATSRPGEKRTTRRPPKAKPAPEVEAD